MKTIPRNSLARFKWKGTSTDYRMSSCMFSTGRAGHNLTQNVNHFDTELVCSRDDRSPLHTNTRGYELVRWETDTLYTKR